MIRFLAVALILLAWSGVAEGAKSPPPPVTSTFLVTKSASFTIIDTVGVSYALTCSLRVALGIPVYATIKFENPVNRKSPLIVNQKIEAGGLELQAQSSAFRSIRNGGTYRVEVLLFKDEARTQHFAEHEQRVYFEIPPKLAEVLRIELL